MTALFRCCISVDSFSSDASSARGCRPLETLLDRGDGAPVCSFFLARDESVGVSSEWSPLLLPRLLDKSLLRLLDKSLLRLHDKSLLRLLEKSLLRLHDRSLLLLHDSSLLLNNSQVELGCSVLAGCSSLARRDLSARILFRASIVLEAQLVILKAAYAAASSCNASSSRVIFITLFGVF